MENNITLDRIKQLAGQIQAEVQSIRHHLHAHPELSFQEKETSAFIMSMLDKYGIPYSTGWAGYGIVATIQGGKPGKHIGLRGDMDALPIEEKNEVGYKSKHAGIMHACGHDVHTSCVLGAGIILHSLREHIPGTVTLLFQPGEEKLPGGANMMIKEGVLDKHGMDAIIAQHVYPSMEAGKVGFKSGLYMASADEVYLTVRGKGGHAAMPQDNADTLLMAAHILVNLQDIVARKAHPAIPTVLSFGKINSDGGATNVIPDTVRMEGTFRTMDETWRTKAHGWITKISQDTAAAFGGSCDVRIDVGYPCLMNDPVLTESARKAAKAYLGEENTEELPLRMTSEDFSFFSQHIPVTFYRLGTANKSKGITSPVHTSTFDIDEEALPVGCGLMAWIAVSRLEEMKG